MLRLGLLSTARINRLLVAGAAAVDGVEVVLVGSRELARAERHGRELGVPRAVASYEAVLEDPEVDAVYIALPNSEHVTWSVRALQAGKHVLCEKPLARDAAAVERAFAAAESAGRLLSEAFMWRHSPQTRRLAELLAEGSVGELRLVRSSFSFGLDDPANVRMSAELEGGSLMDVGCYCVSGSRLFAGGEPESVFGQARTDGEAGVDLRFAGTLRFPGEVMASFDCGFDMVARHDLELVGSEGSLFAADPWHARRPGIERRGPDGEVERIEVEAANSYALELDDMSAAIRDGGRPLLGRDDALGQARTIEALHASAAAGRATRMEEEQ